MNSTSNGFDPKNKTISVGTRLVWWNSTNSTHTVTSTDGSGELNSGNVAKGTTFGHTFNTVGVYTYHCAIHSAMTGTITVN